MDIQVPSNCTSITLATSGVKVPAAGIISGVNAAEGTLLVQYHTAPAVVSTASNGDTILSVPSVVTSMTINGVVRAVVAGIVASMPATDATNFLKEQLYSTGFRLVVG